MPGRRASHDVAGMIAGAVISMIAMTAGWSLAALAEGDQATDEAAKQGTPPAAEGPAIDVAAVLKDYKGDAAVSAPGPKSTALPTSARQAGGRRRIMIQSAMRWTE